MLLAGLSGETVGHSPDGPLKALSTELAGKSSDTRVGDSPDEFLADLSTGTVGRLSVGWVGGFR